MDITIDIATASIETIPDTDIAIDIAIDIATDIAIDTTTNIAMDVTTDIAMNIEIDIAFNTSNADVLIELEFLTVA